MRDTSGTLKITCVSESLPQPDGKPSQDNAIVSCLFYPVLTSPRPGGSRSSLELGKHPYIGRSLAGFP